MSCRVVSVAVRASDVPDSRSRRRREMVVKLYCRGAHGGDGGLGQLGSRVVGVSVRTWVKF